MSGRRRRSLMPVVGWHARRIREQAGLTQEQVGQRSRLSGDTVRRVEKGVCQPSLTTLHKLSIGLGVSLTELIARVEGSRRGDPESGEPLQPDDPELGELFALMRAHAIPTRLVARLVLVLVRVGEVWPEFREFIEAERQTDEHATDETSEAT